MGNLLGLLNLFARIYLPALHLLLFFSWLKVPVRSMEEFQEVYSIGVQRRKVAHTGLNDVSSRSHAVLSIRISNDTVKGKLNLIDLAGTAPCNEVHITCKGFAFSA
jgi:hypothetical protein